MCVHEYVCTWICGAFWVKTICKTSYLIQCTDRHFKHLFYVRHQRRCHQLWDYNVSIILCTYLLSIWKTVCLYFPIWKTFFKHTERSLSILYNIFTSTRMNFLLFFFNFLCCYKIDVWFLCTIRIFRGHELAALLKIN